MTIACLVLLLCAPADEPATNTAQIDTIVICPAEFQAALEPWREHRRRQGHRITVESNADSPEAVRNRIRRAAAGGALRYVLLVGDADPAMSGDAALRKRSVPTHHARAIVNVRFGSETHIATDNWFADLDDDRVPDLAIGRLTCDSATELSHLVRKILDYEQSADFGVWRRQIHFVAGLGGFGALADGILEAAAKTLITEGIPPAYTTTMTYGSWQSPYCPDPRRFAQVTLDRLNEGSLFWVYIGHGQQRAVDQVQVPGGAYPIFSSRDTAQLDCRHAAPIACFLACYSGAFDQPRDCLAEEMLRSPGGPVAVVCGSRVTMPYAMTVMGSELLSQVFSERAETLGAAILAAKRHMMEPEKNNRQRAALDAMARAISPTAEDLHAERAEHLDLFNLLGDPLLRLPYPREVQITVEPTAESGTTIQVSGDSPLDGACTVELVVRRDRLTFQPPRRGSFDSAVLDDYAEVYQRANDPRLASAQVQVHDGRFTARLDIPPQARGACHVRVFVQAADACAAGAADIRIDRPTVAATPTRRGDGSPR